MEKEQFFVDENRLKEIQETFNSLGLFVERLPEYTDPESFANTFKQCSIYEDVPLLTSDSSVLQSSREV